MWNFLEKLFVQHDWNEIDDEHRECRVCGRVETADNEVMILGPNPWIMAKRGDIQQHLSAAGAKLPIASWLSSSEAYENGHAAYYVEGTVPNPHARGAKDYEEWDRGYRDAEGRAW